SPNSVIHFIGDWYGTDSTEYVDGEVVYAKAMNRTGSAQSKLSSAPETTVEINSRQARPYPPARLRVNGHYFPATLPGGALTVTWAHRDRVLQADQLIDSEQPSVGPEAGVTYNVRWFLNDALAHSEAGVSGTSASYSPAGGGIIRVEVESVRDGLTSWQMQVREFYIGAPLLAENGAAIT